MRVSSALLFASAALISANPAWAFDRVVASIKPVHSLVAGVMQGVGEPRLIVRGAASPHTHALRPSDAAALEDAQLVFWIGPDMEAFLGKALESLADGARVVELAEAEGLRLLPFREGGAFAAHDHGEQAEAHHEEGHGHARGEFDVHVWLDPENAEAMVGAIEAALAEADPGNAATYRENAAALRVRLDALAAEIETELAPVRGKSFIVFHDAYHYFEDRFGIQAAGTITVSPEMLPGAERVAEIKAKLAELGAACVFSEPQFEPRLVDVIVEGTHAKSGMLDPEGGSLAEGPDLYFDLMRNIAASLRDCLAPDG